MKGVEGSGIVIAGAVFVVLGILLLFADIIVAWYVKTNVKTTLWILFGIGTGMAVIGAILLIWFIIKNREKETQQVVDELPK